jgi:hypothetical protein
MLMGCNDVDNSYPVKDESDVVAINETVAQPVKKELPVEANEKLDDYEHIYTLENDTKVYIKEFSSYYDLMVVQDGIYAYLEEVDLPTSNSNKNMLIMTHGKGNILLYDAQIHEMKMVRSINASTKEHGLVAKWYDHNNLVYLYGSENSFGGQLYFYDTLNDVSWRFVVSKDHQITDFDFNYNEMIVYYTNGSDIIHEETFDMTSYDLNNLQSIGSIPPEFEMLYMDQSYLLAEEITSLPYLDYSLTEEDMTDYELIGGDAFPRYKDGAFEYTFTMYAPELWRLSIVEPTKLVTPRGINIGDTFEEVMMLFPNEYDWTKTINNVLYGESSYLANLPSASIGFEGDRRKITITTEEYGASMIIYFIDDMVDEIVYQAKKAYN